LENDPELKALGPVHTVEHPFFFSWQGRYRPSDSDRAIQKLMTGYWTRMAKTGNPNGDGDPGWPQAAAGGNGYIEIGASVIAANGPAASHCDFWDMTPMLWPHI